MDSVTLSHTAPVATESNHVFASQLSSLFDSYTPFIKALSLDCFDTLIWRQTASPTDVFHDLQQQPTFQHLGFSAFLRVQAESKARLGKLLREGSSEVTLNEIYQEAFPTLNDSQLKSLQEEELNSEINLCYALPAIVELIRKAKLLGIKIFIVSDTYFTKKQIEQLLKNSLPEDTFQAIDNIFVSSEHNKSKTNGLFKHLIEHAKLPPQSILHIGDNEIADLRAAQENKMNAAQLIHHNSAVSELLRMQHSALALVNPNIRDTQSMSAPFNGMLASAPSHLSPEHLIGYYALGMITYSFAYFIADEIKKLKASGKKPNVAFLMRDAYLPYLAHREIDKENTGNCVRISRFSTYAASFKNQQDIDGYLSDVLFSNRFNEIAKQLLLPEAVSAPIIKLTLAAVDPHATFLKQIHQKHIIKMICHKSTEYRKRLIQHLKNETNINAGETLVMVDLGYSGTTQNRLESIIREELNVDVTGRYLIALGVPNWKATRCGLLDPSWCDERALRALIAYISLLEKLCTTHEPSVIDYDDKGHPVFSEATSADHEEAEHIQHIQQQSLQFAKDAAQFYSSVNKNFNIDLFKSGCLAALYRLLYLPTKTEITHLQPLRLDINMGSKDIFSLFDQNKGLESLHKRGLFYSSMERTQKNVRTNYPAELRAAGLELGISFLTQQRYGLTFNLDDASLRRETLNLIIMSQANHSQVALNASHTYDEYYSLVVPVGNGNIQVGVLFGQQYEWIQLQSIELVEIYAFLQPTEADHTIDAWSMMHTDQMQQENGNLYKCLSETSLLILVPSIPTATTHYVARIVFRPITKREVNAN